MAKYRGINKEGKTRGKYETVLLVYEPKTDEEMQKLYSKLIDYLYTRGQCIYRGPDRNNVKRAWSCYHIAGASITMSSMFKDTYTKRTREIWHDIPYRYIQLTIVSNDGLEDVIKRIQDNFPVLYRQTDLGKKMA